MKLLYIFKDVFFEDKPYIIISPFVRNAVEYSGWLREQFM